MGAAATIPFRRRTRRGVAFGALAFRLTIISSVESRTFKNYAGTSANKPAYFFMALRAFFERLIGNFLKYIKYLIAILTFIFISRHSISPLPYRSPEIRANSSISLRCSRVNRLGISTLTLTSSSPVPLPCKSGIPFPLSLKIVSP